MLSTALVEIHDAVPVLFAALVLACIATGRVLVRAPRGGRRAAGAVTAAALVGMLVLTLFPTGDGRAGGGAFCAVQLSWPDPGAVESVANIAMPLPLACFATLASRRPVLVLAGGASLSAAIELMQATVAAIGRACDTGDVEMNTIGTLLGVLIAVLLLVTARPTPARSPLGSDPAIRPAVPDRP